MIHDPLTYISKITYITYPNSVQLLIWTLIFVFPWMTFIICFAGLVWWQCAIKHINMSTEAGEAVQRARQDEQDRRRTDS